jgi:hypothetical protein
VKAFNSQKFLLYIKAAAAFALITTAYQNCGQPRFSIDSAAKAEKIGEETVFRDPGVDPGGGEDRDPGVDPNGDDRDPGKDPGACTDSKSFKIKFAFECSNMQSEQLGGNLTTMQAVKIVIVSRTTKKVACEINGDFRTEILNTKELAFTSCPNLPAGNYSAYIVDASAATDSYKRSALNDIAIKFSINSSGALCGMKSRPVELLYDFNNKDHRYADDVKKFGSSTADTQLNCDTRKSPLIISLSSQARGVQLTAPLDGILFDILGQRSFPFPHAPKQISWLTEEDHGYYFITLPNRQGEVQGIDELFGDNTRGPDGHYAKNGYLALAKYDDNKDGLITIEDSIFADLRLWNDSNRDGNSDPGELFTMSEKSIMVIDLDYDESYVETDIYGNQTKMKSVVKTEDGELHLMFDLWFRVLNTTKQ